MARLKMRAPVLASVTRVLRLAQGGGDCSAAWRLTSPLRVVAVAIGHDLPAAIAYVWRTHGRADLVPETGPVIFVDVHELVGVVVVAVD